MVRATLALLSMVLTMGPLASSPARAYPVKGVIKLPRSLLDKLARLPRGHWRALRNPLLPIATPLLDPRRRMIVAIEGDARAKPAYPATITISDAQFLPPVLAVRKNTEVSFENKDWQLHLLEPSGAKGFMKPLTIEPGDKGTHRFSKTGAYQLHCSELPHMRATVLVTDKAQVALPDNNGVFRFPNVRAGTYQLAVWYAGKWIHRQPLTVRAGQTHADIVINALKTTEKKD
ncbi:MAG: hypothetical protein CSA65_01665 [Proteobacteria bacterium]|nr:MAG: hypothetical protein CSA65_01665 [Pseudomonadota bacterium]